MLLIKKGEKIFCGMLIVLTFNPVAKLVSGVSVSFLGLGFACLLFLILFSYPHKFSSFFIRLILFSNFRLYIFIFYVYYFSHAVLLEHKMYMLWSQNCLHRMVTSFYMFLCAWIPFFIYPSFCREIRPRNEWNSHNYLQSFFSLLLYFKVDRFFLPGKPFFQWWHNLRVCVYICPVIHHRAMTGVEREECRFHS